MADGHGILPSPQSSSPAPTNQPRGQPRRYGFACSNCRRRKARCDGGLPACRKCAVAGEACNYDNRPSTAFAVTLQHQLKAYQDRFEELRRVKDEERDALLAEPISAVRLRGGKSRALSPSENEREAAESGAQLPASTSDTDTDELPETMSVGTDGQVYFYGKTSLYHLDAKEDRQSEASNRDDSISPGAHPADQQLRHNEQKELCAFLAGVAPSLLEELLETYWCWPHHLHCVLCKKIFLRDLKTLGPYVSPFLLSSVLAQAARYSERADAAQIGDHFAKRALHLLVKDIDRGSSIPAIQGLLILSARECACGRTSQGWLYSGMAFRMARDLGIHVAPKRLGPLSMHFSDEDLALRHQLFWSCYTWDKTMSLCLGRAPIVIEKIDLPTTETLLDGREADEEIWQPRPARNSIYEGLSQQRSSSSTRFIAYCELCVIIYDVLDKLYSRPHPAHRDHMLAYLTQTLEKLDSWSSKLAPEISIPDDSRGSCPPLHILLLNLLYHTTAILLCRPYRAVSTVAWERCTKAAQMTDALFTMHVRRFGFRCITWLQTYTMFVACTINVRDFRESQSLDGSRTNQSLAQQASARLEFGLEVLRQADTTPSAGRCASMIARLLQNISGADKGQVLSRGGPSNAPSTENTKTVQMPPNQEIANAMASIPGQEPVPGPFPSQSLDAQVSQADAGGTALANVQFPVNEILPMGPDLARSGIETPFQWLPENVYDDGSWMLTEVDINSWPLFNVPP